MLPAGNPAKSAGLAAAGRRVAGPELEVDRGHGGGDVARLGVRRRPEVGALVVGRSAPGLVCSSSEGPTSSKALTSNDWRVTL